MLESCNAGGKSSVVKALVAVISLTRDENLSKFALNEAVKLGIRTNEPTFKEGFVNIHADKGSVRLVMGKETRTLEIGQNGDYVELPKEGDQRLLLTGILSNDTKILRQLRDLDEQHEPDDFKWAVSELSHASRYDEITQLLKIRRDKLKDELFVLDRNIDKRAKLVKRRTKLLERRSTLDEELDKMKSRHEEIREVLDERDRLRSNISNWTETIGNIRGSLTNIRTKIQSFEGKMSHTHAEIEKLEQERNSLDIERTKQHVDTRKAEIEAEVNQLITKRSELDGILNLFVTAQASMRRERDETKCPLCEDGSITYEKVSSRLENLRKQRDKSNGEISSLNLEKHRLGLELKGKTERMKEVKLELGTLLDYRQQLTTEYEQLKSTISGDEDKIRDYEGRIAKADEEIESISRGIGPEYEKVQRIYAQKEAEHRETSEQIAVANQQIKETSVELARRTLTPDLAKRILNKWLNLVDELVLFSQQRAEDQRRQAAREFNSTIKKMMQTLGFKEFRTIMLNRDYRLFVERLNEKTGDYVFQQVKTLSTSEKLSIALILQMALKETYLPDMPFFILDDIIEDFDDERRQKILGYLSGKAREKDWFVVVTKLVEDLEPVRLRVT